MHHARFKAWEQSNPGFPTIGIRALGKFYHVRSVLRCAKYVLGC